MDINPLFTLFTQYANYAMAKQPGSDVYLHVNRVGTGHVSIIYDGESLTPFSWNKYNEGLHQLRTQIAILKHS